MLIKKKYYVSYKIKTNFKIQEKCKYWDIFWLIGLLSATIEKRKLLLGVWRNW